MGEQPATDRAVWPVVILTVVIASMPALWAQSGQRPGKTDPAAGKSSPAAGKDDEPSDPTEETPAPSKPGGLRMSRAVVCKSIDGFENYKPLVGASQTSDEKLLVYYRPLRYKIDFVDGVYRAHLIQDNEIRRRGQKVVLRQKRKVVEYDPKSKDPLGPIYIRNTISLKGLEPGDYDLTIILHDERDKAAPPSRQVVKFKVVRSVDPRLKPVAEKDEDPSPEP